jgi:integrase/recombinase XerD
MPAKLTTTINKIQSVPNQINSVIINEFYQYMKDSDSSVHQQNNNFKVVIAFANFVGTGITFYEIEKKEQILEFLNTKIKDPNHNPEK